MRRVRFVLAVLFLAVASVPAPADEPTTIKVTVRGFSTDRKIFVTLQKWPSGEELKSVPTTSSDQGRTVTVMDSKDTPLPPGTYKVSAGLTERTFAEQIVYVGAGNKLEIVLDSGKSKSLGYEVGQAFKNAAEAKSNGATEAYKYSAADIQNGLAQDERLANEAQAATEAFARDNGLRVTNLAGAEKDLNKLKKLGASADQEVKGNLERYIEKLKAADTMRQDLDASKQRFAELEQRRFSMGLPSTCPQGQGGGLLAGSLNALFGTDLAGACEDGSLQGDRDRHNGKRGAKEQERD